MTQEERDELQGLCNEQGTQQKRQQLYNFVKQNWAAIQDDSLAMSILFNHVTLNADLYIEDLIAFYNIYNDTGGYDYSLLTTRDIKTRASKLHQRIEDNIM